MSSLFSHFSIVSYHNIKLNKGGCFFKTEESWGSRLVRTKTRPSQTTDMDGWMDGWMDGHFGPWKYPSHLRAVVKKNRSFYGQGDCKGLVNHHNFPHFFCETFLKLSWNGIMAAVCWVREQIGTLRSLVASPVLLGYFIKVTGNNDLNQSGFIILTIRL